MTLISSDSPPRITRHRALRTSPERIAFAGILLFLGAVCGATITWGLPGLAMSALAMVPVITVALLLITVGK